MSSTASDREVPSGIGPVRLDLRGVTKSYGRVQSLTDIDMSVHVGETVGLLGDNGAGKSTLIKVIAGAVRPDAGTISWEGRPVAMASRQDAARLGIEAVYQDGALCESMPIWRNIFLTRELTWPLGILKSKRMREASTEVLSGVVQLGAISPDQWIGELSGGQRQAVAIARAVSFKRTVLLLDEPTSALGVREVEALLEYVRSLKAQGVASVLVTHNLHHAYQVCDRFIVLMQGRVTYSAWRAETSVEELTERLTQVPDARPGGS